MADDGGGTPRDIGGFLIAEEPKLVEQLRLLRDEWGEGFDEDIARPLARIVKTLREQHESLVGSLTRERDESFDRSYELEMELEAAREAAPDAMLEDLRDVERGVRDFGEVMRIWMPVSV